MKTLKMWVGMDTFVLSSFFFQSLLTNHMIWCCCPLIFQMGIILPLILRYNFCWNHQENCLCEIWRIRPLKGKIPFISLFQASELGPAELRKRWGQVQPGLAVSHAGDGGVTEGSGRLVPCRAILGSSQAGTQHECLPAGCLRKGLGCLRRARQGGYVCTILTFVLLCKCFCVTLKDSFPLLLSRSRGRKAMWNMPGKEE